MKFTDSLADIDSLEGELLYEFIEISLEHISLMKELIENGSVLTFDDDDKLNSYSDIVGFHQKLLDFFEKSEDYETCCDIKGILDFLEKKNS